MRLLVGLILLASLNTVHAEETSFVDKIRPKFVNLIGESLTSKILGKDNSVKLDEVEFPAIPKIEESATSVAVYNKEADKIKIAPEEEAKYNYVYVKELYDVTRQTKPNEDEMAKMMNVLSQGGTREGVYRSLVLDSVYGGMENWDRPVKSVSADFAVYFYEKYLGRTIKKKSLEGMSIYTLKRLLTERSLEVVGAFQNDRDALERWYAVLSADLATRFPQIWPNEMRKNKSALAHKNWAAHVPVQHIKSELIIKTHAALNSML